MRVLLVTGMYPTPERPGLGGFVRDQVEALRAIGGVEIELFVIGSGGSARWVTADEGYGQVPSFRDTVDAEGWWYVVEVPSTTRVFVEEAVAAVPVAHAPPLVHAPCLLSRPEALTPAAVRLRDHLHAALG